MYTQRRPVEPWQDLGRWVPALDGSDEAAVLDTMYINFLVQEKKD
jgi:hypothetical protein